MTSSWSMGGACTLRMNNFQILSAPSSSQWLLKESGLFYKILQKCMYTIEFLFNQHLVGVVNLFLSQKMACTKHICAYFLSLNFYNCVESCILERCPNLHVSNIVNSAFSTLRGIFSTAQNLNSTLSISDLFAEQCQRIWLCFLAIQARNMRILLVS